MIGGCDRIWAGYDEAVARDMFKAVDTDGSGLVELNEFFDWFKGEEMKQKGGREVVAHLPSTGIPVAAADSDAESDLDVVDVDDTAKVDGYSSEEAF